MAKHGRVMARGQMSVHRYVGAFLILFVASLFGAYYSGDIHHWWWHLGTLAAPVIIVLLGRIGYTQRAMLVALWIAWAAFALGVGGMYVLYLIGVTDTPQIESAVNRNILASGIAISGFGVALFSAKARAFTIPISLLAVFATNGRTAIIAMLVGVLAVLFFSRRQRAVNTFVAIALTSLGAALLYFGPQIALSRITPILANPINLLAQTGDIRKEPWHTRYNASVEITELANAPPQRWGQAYRIKTTQNPEAEYPNIALIQSIFQSELDQEYVASAWFRSNKNTEVVLGNNFTKATCPVTQTWTRCVAPGFLGDGRRQVQLRLEYAPDASTLDVEIWGPQVEFGMEAQPTQDPAYLARVATWRRVLERLVISEWSEDSTVLSRIEGWNFALSEIKKRPWFGAGIGRFPETIAQHPEVYQASHAHNLILDILFERGVIGLLVFVTTIVLTAKFVSPPRWALAAVLIFLGTLDSANYVFYTREVYYLFWVIFSLLLMLHTKQPAKTPKTSSQG